MLDGAAELVVERAYPDVTLDEYHKRPELSSSGIRTFAKCGPWQFLAENLDFARSAASLMGTRLTEDIDEVAREDTDSTRLGRAFHLAMQFGVGHIDAHVVQVPKVIADDEHLEAVIASIPDGSKATRPEPGDEINMNLKYHRGYVDGMRARAQKEGKDWVTANELHVLKRQVEAVFANPACRDFLEQPGAELEKCCVGLCAKTGLPVKAIADLLLPALGVVLDFKTTRAKTANEFVYDALKVYSYAHQGDWYLRVFGHQLFKLISVRGKPPYEAMLYDLPKNVLLGGRSPLGFERQGVRTANNFHLEAIRNCVLTDSWHSMMWGTPDGIPLDPDERFPQ